MNFPGLDSFWRGTNGALHAAGFLPTWSLQECIDALAQNEHVLVVATTALGDSLLTTPLIESLAAALGPERVSLLVKEPYADLYRGDSRLRRIFTVRGKYRWGELRRHLQDDPHRLALLSNLTEPDLVPWLRWNGVRGFLRYRSRDSRYPAWIANRDMLRRHGTPDYATGHAIENNLAMAGALNLPSVAHQLDLPHLSAPPFSGDRVVLIHPGASRAVKRWPVENWAKLADALVERFDCDIHLTGDRSETALTESVRQKMQSSKRAQSIAGHVSLRELAGRQAASIAFLSGDTGPYHLALAVNCPTVTLFAPTDRGSSIEACGPYQADPVFHRALQTAQFGDSIATMPFDAMLRESCSVVEASLARRRTD